MTHNVEPPMDQRAAITVAREAFARLHPNMPDDFWRFATSGTVRRDADGRYIIRFIRQRLDSQGPPERFFEVLVDPWNASTTVRLDRPVEDFRPVDWWPMERNRSGVSWFPVRGDSSPPGKRTKVRRPRPPMDDLTAIAFAHEAFEDRHPTLPEDFFRRYTCTSLTPVDREGNYVVHFCWQRKSSKTGAESFFDVIVNAWSGRTEVVVDTPLDDFRPEDFERYELRASRPGEPVVVAD